MRRFVSQMTFCEIQALICDKFEMNDVEREVIASVVLSCFSNCKMSSGRENTWLEYIIELDALFYEWSRVYLIFL